MKQILTLISLFFLFSCGSSSESTNEIDISGRWTECREIAPSTIVFTEVIFSDSNSALESNLFGSMDNQCINLFSGPGLKTNATVVLDNSHATGSGLMVYDYTLVNVTEWDNLSSTITPLSNFYSILYMDGGKLYFGELTVSLDGTSEERRPDQIDFSKFLTKQ